MNLSKGKTLSRAASIIQYFTFTFRVPAPTAGVVSILPGRPRPGKISLQSLSSYLGIYI